MAGFNTDLGTGKNSARKMIEPIEKADVGHKRDLFAELASGGGSKICSACECGRCPGVL